MSIECGICERDVRSGHAPDCPKLHAKRAIKMTRESEIEDYLVKMVRSHGGEVRKIKFIGRDGAPDRLVMLPSQPVRPGGQLWSEPRTFWVELKAPGLAATFPSNAHERKQHREHERMRRMGQRVEIVDSFDGVDELFGI